ncbi:GNAT family N-acetyltransferase [Boseongicola aestuarii]|jgi:GNAT superfamily N-acetyltransferase|uniref:Acetyltransferase (GNAT) family protein n=1 Tax=Boseongicola aestuarii TaxID=1470561 RepID=A0A238J0V6_9RHOB|nr:GNAT family N-acetyltransferase [Boseongicola aestuarii]SMX23534.1 Acetyltransferase (GNAT) family protein [Boseongicola aestuarii]
MTRQCAGTEVAYTVTYLEMDKRPSWDWPHLPVGAQVSLMQAEKPPVWFFLSLYDAVGRDYAWEDIHKREHAEIQEWLTADAMSLYVLYGHGWPHGFFLLEDKGDGVVDIAYFALVPEAIGRGLGKWLLRTAILTAWDRPGAKKLTVNTCTLDHPRALQTYQKSGFTPVRREDRTRVLTRDRDLSRIPS